MLLDPTAPYRTEAGLTLASLQLALDQPEAALETLTATPPGSATPPQSPASSSTRWKSCSTSSAPQKPAKRCRLRKKSPPETASARRFWRRNCFSTRAIRRRRKPAFRNSSTNRKVSRCRFTTPPRSAWPMPSRPRENRRKPRNHCWRFSRITRTRRNWTPIFERILHWLPEKPTATDPVLERIAQWITPPVAASHRADFDHPSHRSGRRFRMAGGRRAGGASRTCWPIRSTPAASGCTASARRNPRRNPAACSSACGSSIRIIR